MTEPPVRSIVVGLSDSPGSQRALAWSARLARATGARVVAVHVLTFDRELARDFSLDTMRNWRAELRASITSWAAPLERSGVEHECRIVEADSNAQGLLDAADEVDADLVVVGPRAYRLGHHAHRPVVVVPSTWQAAVA